MYYLCSFLQTYESFALAYLSVLLRDPQQSMLQPDMSMLSHRLSGTCGKVFPRARLSFWKDFLPPVDEQPHLSASSTRAAPHLMASPYWANSGLVAVPGKGSRDVGGVASSRPLQPLNMSQATGLWRTELRTKVLKC